MRDYGKLLEIFIQVFNIELIKSYGKYAIDKIDSICKELLSWEYELQGIIPPNEFKEVKELMIGWSKIIIDAVNSFSKNLEKSLSNESLAKYKNLELNFTLAVPPSMVKVNEILKQLNSSHY